MQYQSIAASLSLLFLMSACSGSNNSANDPGLATGSNTSLTSPLPNETDGSDSLNPVSEPQDQPLTNDGAVASDDEGMATTSGNSSDEGAGEASMAGTRNILNPDNADAVILQAFEIYSGRAYDKRMTGFPYIEKIAVQFQEPQFNEFNDVLVYRSLGCNNGDVSETSSEAYQPLMLNSLYTDCTIASDQLNGRVFLSEGDNGGFQRRFSDLFSVNFTGDGIMEISGNYHYRTSLSYIRELVVADLNYNLSYDGGALSIQNANTTRKYRLDGIPDENNVISMMEGSFTMIPPVLNGASVSVTTTEAFANDEKSSQLSYTRGRLQIIASDSEIIVDAANGDPETVEVSLIGSTGPVTTRTVNWQRWHDALAFEPPGLTEHTEQAIPQLGSEAALLTQNSYTDILRSAFDIYSGESIGPAILQMPGYPMPEFPPGIGTQSFPYGFAEPVLETCDNGGSAVLTPYKWGARQITTGWNAEFSNCDRGGVLYEGIFKTRDYGNFTYRSPYADNTQGEGGFEITAAHSLFSGVNPYLRSISGKFHMKNAATGQNWVAVSTPDPLTTAAYQSDTEYNDYPITGLMIIDAGNGNSLWLRPDNGDEQTFDIFIYATGADPIRLTEAWSDWLPYIQFNYDLHNR